MIDDARLYPLLGERLRKLREEHQSPKGKMTQAKLAGLVGLERTSITNIEKGTQKVPLHVLYRICEVLNAHVATVMPAMAEVTKLEETPQSEAFELGGRTYHATPMVMQKISALISNLEVHDDSH